MSLVGFERLAMMGYGGAQTAAFDSVEQAVTKPLLPYLMFLTQRDRHNVIFFITTDSSTPEPMNTTEPDH